MNISLAAVIVSLLASTAFASGGAAPWAAMERVERAEDVDAPPPPAKAQTKPAAAPAAAAPKADATPAAPQASDRTLDAPWAGLQPTGPLPTFANNAPCVMPGDNFSPSGPKCPAGYTPGRHPMQCGGYNSIVQVADSVICASNSIGIGQLKNGDISADDRSQAEAFLAARGLPPSAAAYAALAMNGGNLQAYTCQPYLFMPAPPMSAFNEVPWNLILFDYVYGSYNPTKQTSLPMPALCKKKFNS